MTFPGVRTPSEFDLQRAFTLWLKGDQHRAPALRPGVVAWHTPNGGERRDAFEGKRLKQSGVEAGVHDYLFLWGGLYGLELKKPGRYRNPDDGLSDAQRNMHARMLAAGMVASAVVDNLADAKRIVFDWGLTLTVN